jgi:hypothetical protein
MVQLTFALACHIYEPHQYRERARLDRAVNNLPYTFQYSPAPIGRLSQGIDFPALVLAFPLRNNDNPVCNYNCVYTLIWISVRDLAVFAGIVLFWCWVGSMLDKPPGSSRLRVAEIWVWSGVVVFGVLTGLYALSLLASPWRPYRQIGIAGAVWAAVLMTFGIWRAAARRNSNPTSGRPGN